MADSDMEGCPGWSISIRIQGQGADAVRRSTYQNVALVAGIVLVAIATVAELASWGESGFGALQQLFLVLGLAAAALGVLPQDAALGKMVQQAIFIFGAAYVSLLMAEVGLLVVTPYEERIDPVLTLRGSVVATSWGFDLKPGWRGLFQDGMVSAVISVNAVGNRDRDPEQDGRRLLLLGDSVAFGYALSQEETIDAQIESATRGRIDAVNLGVLGYGPGETAAKLASTTATRASDVIYVFNGNDLRDDARFGSYRVWEGYLVPARKADGSAYTEDEYREHAQAKESDTTLRKVLSLVGTRNLLARLVEPDRDRVMGPLESYKPDGIEHALEQTKKMKELAEARGARFTVVVVPMKGEAAPESYAAPTRRFLERLKDAEIPTLDLHERLTLAEHYFNHDPHLNAEGARETAAAIVELLEK
jgi:hypothetical protein